MDFVKVSVRTSGLNWNVNSVSTDEEVSAIISEACSALFSNTANERMVDTSLTNPSSRDIKVLFTVRPIPLSNNEFWVV